MKKKQQQKQQQKKEWRGSGGAGSGGGNGGARIEQRVTESDLRTMAEDPQKQVYKYEHVPVSRSWTADECTRVIGQLRDRARNLREKFPTWSASQCASAAVNLVPDASAFKHDHPHLMDKIMDLGTPDDQMDHIRFMLHCKSQCERGVWSTQHAQEQVQGYLLNKYKSGRAPLPGESVLRIE